MAKQGEPPFWAKVSIGIVLIIALVLIWVFMAGNIFVHLQDINASASLTTFPNYWMAYSDDPAVKPWLVGSMIGATAVIALPIAFIAFLIKEKARSLYGDARWASTQEIKDAGLLGNSGILVGEIGRASCRERVEGEGG